MTDGGRAPATPVTMVEPPVSHRSGLAIASLVLGIASFVLCLSVITGIPALVCGIVALVRIQRSGGQVRGMGLAIAGTVLGGISLLILPIMLGLLLPAFAAARAETRLVKCRNNLMQIGIAVQSYAMSNGERLPYDARGPLQSLALLYPSYVTTPQVFLCPEDDEDQAAAFPADCPLAGQKCSYVYSWHLDASKLSPSHAVMADRPTTHGEQRQRFNVLYFDGHVAANASPYCSSDPTDHIFQRDTRLPVDVDVYLEPAKR
jgi:prepilin-type processing-associated H-X9-DG protein